MSATAKIPAVNFHLWKHCNMRCSFCFATFQDVVQDTLPRGHLPREEALEVVAALAGAGFDKINFAGGEPTLCPWLPDLIREASRLGLTTSMVTNGSILTADWLDGLAGDLDWVAVSIDTLDHDRQLRLGRVANGRPMSEEDHARIVDLLRERGIRVKINTVVSRVNCDEDLTGFIASVLPERWKLLQVLPVRGQNDGSVDDLLIGDEEFGAYVERNQGVESLGIRVVPESNALMTGSYAMVDPAGRFFDNVAGEHSYSRPINEVGVEDALRDITTDPDRFRLRGGIYDW